MSSLRGRRNSWRTLQNLGEDKICDACFAAMCRSFAGVFLASQLCHTDLSAPPPALPSFPIAAGFVCLRRSSLTSSLCRPLLLGCGHSGFFLSPLPLPLSSSPRFTLLPIATGIHTAIGLRVFRSRFARDSRTVARRPVLEATLANRSRPNNDVIANSSAIILCASCCCVFDIFASLLRVWSAGMG